MADTNRRGDAGVGGTGEDATSRTPVDAAQNVGAGRAGGAGTVADDGSRAERSSTAHAGNAHGDLPSGGSDEQAAGADVDSDRRPILGSGTIGVGAGGAADRPTRLSDSAPAYVPRDASGTQGHDSASAEMPGSAAGTAPTDSVSAPMGADSRADAQGGDNSRSPEDPAVLSGEETTGAGAILDIAGKSGVDRQSRTV